MALHNDPTIATRALIPAVEDFPDDIQEKIKDVTEKSGFTPNVFRAIAARPEEWRAFMQMHDSLIDRQTPGLSKADRELIVVATSAQNDCLYCVIAHGAIARIRAKNPYIADQLAIDWRKADLDDRMKVVIEVAVKLAVTPAQVTDEDQQRLRDAGLSDEDVADVGAIVAFFAMSNRLAHWSGLQPNAEFFTMGREPKQK
ncbi:peroxidase-related enzyme [Blastococcus sp. Marseille-P5729]|uniref:peroxidase-related enzyme n=1 Tax=Blastococcus sp. Marseille-P5729 TaxID=2086582 RepID=UPI000D10CCCD|nr:peroxidase-related enzyme [Blastococcus sp. Marseille-P5729]